MNQSPTTVTSGTYNPAMPQPNRRLGARLPTPPVDLVWNITKGGGFFKKKKAEEGRAMVQDVSVSGVGILAVEDEHLQVGTVVSVRLEGIDGELVIRRLTRSNTPGLVLYGTEYSNTTGPLAHLFQERFMAPAKPLPQDFRDRNATDEYDPYA